MRSAAAVSTPPASSPEPKVEDIKVDVLPEDEIEVVIEGAAEPEPPKVEAPDPSIEKDERTALQKQLDQLTAAEAEAKDIATRATQQAEEERRRADAAVYERDGYRNSSAQSQLDAIENAMAAAQAEADAATRDIEAAINAGNTKAQAEAYRRLSKSESNLGRLEDGKIELENAIERYRETRRAEPEPRREEPKQPVDVIDRMALPARAKDWLRENRTFVEDPRKNAKLMSAHWDALEEGHKEFSTDYFVSLEKLLGLREADKVEPKEQPKSQAPQRREPLVSAPVNRDAPSANGGSRTRVTLTKEEAEHARMSGISDAEYAKQKLRLEDLKKQGLYGESR